MTMFGSQWLANAGADAYEIEQSIRFNDDDSAYLTRTPGSASNLRTWTWSAWIKRCTLSGTQRILGVVTGSSSTELVWRPSGGSRPDALRFYYYSGSYISDADTVALYRDVSAWYHVVLKVDTTQATDTNRIKIYVNGVEQTLVVGPGGPGIYPPVNTELGVNTANAHYMGRYAGAAQWYVDQYMAEINFVDGLSLSPSSFGKTNSATGQWVPKKYTGAYGTNGFHITGADSSDLGKDENGSNDWTSSGLAANDQMSDSPTNNYCTMNSIDVSTITLSNGNLDFVGTGGSWLNRKATMSLPATGKWYWECIATTSGNAGDPNFGIVADTVNTGVSNWYQDALAYVYSTRMDSVVNNDWTGTSRGTYVGGNILQIAYDSSTGKLWFGIQNSWINGGDPADGSDPDFTTSTTPTFLPYVAIYSDKTGSINFGQSAFAYTPPTDFLALNTANLPDPAIEDPSAYFQTTLYEGDGSTQSIDQDGNSTFSPNFVWIKNRDAADAHALFDTVRGATKVLSSNSTAVEATNADTLTAFESDGFALGADVIVNTNAESYVAWQWDAPTTSTNEDGSVDSTLSVSQTSGFSIGTFVGTGSVLTVGHGLGVAPDFVIVRVVNGDGDDNWNVYHSALGNTKGIRLNLSNASGASAQYWNNTSPTSTVTTIGTNSSHNVNTKTSLAYSFAAVEGFSAFGSYEGNTNVNGPMANLGFRPAWLLIKNADATGSWLLFDTARDTYNVVHKLLFGQLANVEDTSTAYLDIVSNGFKIRSTGNGTNNAVTYVYAAFAENPFKTANAR